MRAARGELIGAACGVALLVLMFAFAWYEVDGIRGRPSARGAAATQNGWDGLTNVRWLMLVTALAAIAVPVLRSLRPELARRIPAPGVILGLAALTSLMLVIRVLIDLPSPPSVPDQKLGALLGLAAAIGIALGGWESMLAGRERRASRPRPRLRSQT